LDLTLKEEKKIMIQLQTNDKLVHLTAEKATKTTEVEAFNARIAAAAAVLQ
jgi:hypothetical protein